MIMVAVSIHIRTHTRTYVCVVESIMKHRRVCCNFVFKYILPVSNSTYYACIWLVFDIQGYFM